jgi:hypothetical protein
VHGPLREQREDRRPDVAAAGTPAAAAEPFAATTPVAATRAAARETPERAAVPRHARPWAARWHRREGHATACLAKVLLHLVELGARVAERRLAPE